MTSSGKVCASSHSMTWGAISPSANSRTALRSAICSGVYSKSTGFLRGWRGRAVARRGKLKHTPQLDDLLANGIPANGALLAVAFDGHATGDGNAIAEVEGAVGLAIGADGVEEILHMGLGIGAGDAGHFVAVGPVLLLGGVADSLRRTRDGAGGAHHVLGDAEAFVAESAIPGEEEFLFVLHGDGHGVGHFAAVLPKIDAAVHGDGARNAQSHRSEEH